jgi:hypothetical protein
MKVQDKLGRFAKFALTLSVTNESGQPLSEIKAGESVVSGPFRLVTKDQIAVVIGIVTESMLNATSKEGEKVFEFQGNGWRPQAKVGDILLQDVSNPADRWACGPGLFGGTGWVGTAQDDGSVTYAKPGKPLLALDLPEGTVVVSREGPRAVPAGCILAITNADKGDFYVWTPDVIAKYVRDYTS